MAAVFVLFMLIELKFEKLDLDKYCLYIYSLHSVQRDIYIHTVEGRRGIERLLSLFLIYSIRVLPSTPLKKVGV